MILQPSVSLRLLEEHDQVLKLTFGGLRFWHRQAVSAVAAQFLLLQPRLTLVVHVRSTVQEHNHLQNQSQTKWHQSVTLAMIRCFCLRISNQKLAHRS